ncbi:MAG TPA: DUF4349 domain-containing protein [Williamwhitmania sp.]|nr:DUF4349 domain-containing protein [Williamwhitmania sp.]
MKHFLPILLLVTMACTSHNPFKQAEQATVADTTIHYRPANLPPSLFSRTNAISFLIAGHTANLSELRRGIYALAQKNSSMVKSEFLETTEKGVKGSFVMVVPRQHLDSVLTSLGELPLLVQRQSHSVEDISLTLSNLTQRAREKRDIAPRYNRLLQSASNQQEVARLETAMALNRSDLELLSNEIKDIRSKVDNINITINVQQAPATNQATTSNSSNKAQAKDESNHGKTAKYLQNHWPWLIFLGVVLFMTMAIFKVTKKSKKEKRVKKPKRGNKSKKKRSYKHKNLADGPTDDQIL